MMTNRLHGRTARSTRRLAAITLGVVASAILPVAIQRPAGAALSTYRVPTDGTFLRTWTNVSGLRVQLSMDEAVALAKGSDVIVAATRFFNGQLPAMRQANPNLAVLAYQNGTFAPANRPYPESFYSHDVLGNRITSRTFGDYLMDPSRWGWRKDAAERCSANMAYSGYDGCFVDMLGVGTFSTDGLTSVPIDRTTGLPWTLPNWLAATQSVAKAVNAGNPSGYIIGNGLNNGTRYYHPVAATAQLLKVTDGGNAESFVRVASAAIDKFRNERDWKKDVDMLVASGQAGKSSLMMTKVWVPATEAQLERWHRYTLATFLLGSNGSQSMMFTFGDHGDKVNMHAWDSLDLGQPTATYAKVRGVYQRPFTNGLSLVNPTTATVTVALPRPMVDLAGVTVDSVTLGANTGEVLRG